MQNIDEAQMQELYTNISFNARIEALVAEGKSVKEIDAIMLQEAGPWWTNLKAKAAGAAETVKGLGTTAKGIAQQAAGKVASKAGELAAKGVEAVGGTIDPQKNKLAQAGAELQTKGQRDVQAVKDAALNAKIDSVLNTYTDEINALSNNVIESGKKLGLEMPFNAKEISSMFRSKLKGALAAHRPPTA